MNAHSCTKHTPGTPTCRNKCGCPCPPCVLAKRRETKRRAVERARGISVWVDADSLRADLARILDAVPMSEAERLTGYNRAGMYRILAGDVQRVHQRTANGILTAAASIPQQPAHGLVDARPTLRRAQALATLGWSFTATSRAAGLRPDAMSYMQRRTGPALASTAAAVARFYDTHSMRFATTRDGLTVPSINQAIARAARFGWPPPLAWDEGTGLHGIDNPSAVPHRWQRTNHGGRFYSDELVELIEGGISQHDLLQRTGRQLDSIQRQLFRLGRGDLWTRISTPRLTSRKAA